MRKLINLENLIALTIIAIPAYLVKVVLLGMPINIFEIMSIICIAAFFLRHKKTAGIYKDREKYIFPIGLLIAGLIVSASLNNNYRSEFGIIKSWFIIPLVFSFIASITISKEKIFKAIYVSAVFVAMISLGYLFSGYITFDGRLQAFYNSPNYLAMYLAPAILIGIFKLQSKEKKYLVSIPILLAAFYFTFSYAAWLALVSAAAMIFIIFIKGKNNLKISILMLFVLTIFLMLQIGTKKMDNFIHLNERSSFASRLIIWSSAGRILSDNWLVGIGPGNFQEKYLEYQKYFSPYLEWAVPEPHNLFLAIWLQAGIMGIIGFIFLIAIWMTDVLRKSKNQHLAAMGVAIIAYMLIHGLVDTTYFKNDLAVLFWLTFFAII